jgi:hypothetical protein
MIIKQESNEDGIDSKLMVTWKNEKKISLQQAWNHELLKVYYIYL